MRHKYATRSGDNIAEKSRHGRRKVVFRAWSTRLPLLIPVCLRQMLHALFSSSRYGVEPGSNGFHLGITAFTVNVQNNWPRLSSIPGRRERTIFQIFKIFHCILNNWFAIDSQSLPEAKFFCDSQRQYSNWDLERVITTQHVMLQTETYLSYVEAGVRKPC